MVTAPGSTSPSSSAETPVITSPRIMWNCSSTAGSSTQFSTMKSICFCTSAAIPLAASAVRVPAWIASRFAVMVSRIAVMPVIMF